ncbi:hypothetical protein PGT21_023054 [Puccinia graminis f. sp. tritici]|uniref:Uncharacterized protein n=1 Tax=Puccinia graminis f. sp. tritici TaxID=56615 RepID=A0A5B0MNR5_PUCGR|nr:hypothetical protein PGT21_023054 [Puccinia graminis f. sp. tritici]
MKKDDMKVEKKVILKTKMSLKNKHVLLTIWSMRISSSVPRGSKRLKMGEKVPTKPALPSGKRSQITINQRFPNPFIP